MDNRKAGLVLVLLFYLAVSVMLLSNYKNWEISYGKLVQAFQPVSETLYALLKNHPKMVIEAVGTTGILLSFGAIYGSKFSVRLLTLFTLMFILALNYTTNDIKVQDFQHSVLNVFSLVAITGGLLQGWY